MKEIAFQIGSLEVHWFGLLVTLGIWAGLWVARERAISDGIGHFKVLDLAACLIIGGIIGARALHLIWYGRGDGADQPLTRIFRVHQGGMVSYGAFVGSVMGVFIFSRIKKLPFWRLVDTLSLGFALCSALGRIGCLLAGCCYGRPTTLPWAICFPPGHPTAGYAVHPTQAYDALYNLGLYVALAWSYGNKRFDGQIFALYLLIYPLCRSVVELFRGDYVFYFGGWVTPAHWFALAILPVGFFLYWTLSRKRKVCGLRTLSNPSEAI